MVLNQGGNYGYLQFNAMSITAGAAASSIQGNIIQNIQINTTGSSSTSFPQSIIALKGGTVNMGNITPNIIGSQTVANSISFNQNSGGTSYLYGIWISAGTNNVTNNIISGISIPFTVAGQNVYFAGICNAVTGPAITGNTIGSTTLPNAVSIGNSGVLYGLYITGGATTYTGNIISNLSSTGTAQLSGIYASVFSGVTFSINGNTIQNLTSSSTVTTSGTTASIVGINVSANTAPITITNNVIKGLSNTNTTAAVNITGIFYQGPTTGTNVVSRNFIHSFSLASSATTAGLTGIYANTGTTTYRNNMIRLGIDASGAGLNTGYAINGIYDAAGTNSHFFNSVYLGGTTVTGTTSSTFAFNSQAAGTTRVIQNNIFMNARSGGTTGKHYAITIAGTTPLPTGVTSGFNMLYAPGATGGNTGFYNGAAQLTLSEWRGASGLDNQSGTADPNFVNPTGDISTVDLHLLAPNPIEAAGFLVASVTDDYDGQTRSSFTPTDIGADAGLFTNSGDVFPPAISFTALGNSALLTNLTLTNFATITDNVAVSGGAEPSKDLLQKSN